MREKESIYDICYKIKINFFKEEPSNIEKKEIFYAVKKALKKGWTIDIIYKKLNQAYKSKEGLPDLNLLFAGQKRENLLDPDEKYYHNLLRIVPPNPTVNWDPVTGEVKSEEQEYFMEYKASLTIDELCEYYRTKEQLNIATFSDKHLRGCFDWLVKSFSVDVVLFMIDATVDLINSNEINKIYNPLKIQDSLKLAVSLRDKKITEIVSLGVDSIVPKQRKQVK